MITLQDLKNIISYGEYTVMMEIADDNEQRCWFIEITEDIFDADYFYIFKENYNPIVYQLLFFNLLKVLKPAKGITDDNYETLKMMKKAKLGLIIYWESCGIKKYLLQL